MRMIIILENFIETEVRDYIELFVCNQEVVPNSRYTVGENDTFEEYLALIATAPDGLDFISGSWASSKILTKEQKQTLDYLFSKLGAITIYNREDTTLELDAMMMARKIYMPVHEYFAIIGKNPV